MQENDFKIIFWASELVQLVTACVEKLDHLNLIPEISMLKGDIQFSLIVSLYGTCVSTHIFTQ